ncbi:MAG: NADPH-dependent glutamate synthase [Clostridia bacterium]|nr:NADPH-dependent glutamate synthase [Clostridia bacterium]
MSDILKRIPVLEQVAKARATNFKEVCLGYDADNAKAEALRCLECKNPQCVKGCPVNVDIPLFISQIKKGDYLSAYQIIRKSSSLPAICGRVCPQETQCESKCIRGIKGEAINIGKLERFCADYALNQDVSCQIPTKNGKKVAIIGSGPAGLACAGDLAKLGYDVTVFEALHKLGGVLVYGIPEFRLPKKIVEKEIVALQKLGVCFQKNVIIGKSITVDELFEEGFKAVFIASGAGLPIFMNISGEGLNGVFSANEFLTRSNLMGAYDKNSYTPIKAGSRVVVVGGGNVAMDSARTALRLGAEVHVVYRRSEKELPARQEEVLHAKEEGVIFDLLTNPIEILGKDGEVSGIKLIKMTLCEPDESGRCRPKPIDGSEYVLDCNTVIMALGTRPNPLISSTTKGLNVTCKQCIEVDEDFKTSREGVFAGGDAVTGSATVILAMSAGKQTAISIDKYLRNK